MEKQEQQEMKSTSTSTSLNTSLNQTGKFGLKQEIVRGSPGKEPLRLIRSGKTGKQRQEENSHTKGGLKLNLTGKKTALLVDFWETNKQTDRGKAKTTEQFTNTGKPVCLCAINFCVAGNIVSDQLQSGVVIGRGRGPMGDQIGGNDVLPCGKGSECGAKKTLVEKKP